MWFGALWAIRRKWTPEVEQMFTTTDKHGRKVNAEQDMNTLHAIEQHLQEKRRWRKSILQLLHSPVTQYQSCTRKHTSHTR